MSVEFPTEEEKAELAARIEKRRLDTWAESETYNNSPQRVAIRRSLAAYKKLVIEATLNTDLETASALRDEMINAVRACKEAGASVEEVQGAQNHWYKLLEAGHFRREPGK